MNQLRSRNKGKKIEPPARRKQGKGKKRKGRVAKPYKMRLFEVFWLVPLAFVIGFGSVLGFFIGDEARTSEIQATFFSRYAKEITFQKEDGPAPDFDVPAQGPYNQRLGYSFLPFYIKALEADGYAVESQARVSERYKEAVGKGLYPIYRAKAEAGLLLQDSANNILYRASYPTHVFPDFESLPPLLVDTLLFVENRELLKRESPTHNPVIEWDRFVYAAIGQALKSFVPGINLGGGSTLATQIEKFRFSPEGQTGSAMEKIRQIVSGSLRVYMDGPDTRAARKRIVLDYLNNTPLSARSGFGEINSIGDGFWAWFGRDLESVKGSFALSENKPEQLRQKAKVYREALGLILAQRRPSHYLLGNRAALETLTDQMLRALASANVISPALRDEALKSRLAFAPDPPPMPPSGFLDGKASNAMRTHLLTLLGLRNLYELDRIDLAVTGTLDSRAQADVTKVLKKMGDPDFLKSIGLYGEYLLNESNDPAAIHWSVLLYEKTQDGNVLRVQTDNIEGPLDMNEGVKLDLGSTAKLRTLVTYLEIVGELFRRYAGLSAEDLVELTAEAPDALTSWATTWLASNPAATLTEMLEAAMDRDYSAHPGEAFFTGGGLHSFVNFSKESDYRRMNLREALRDSVNLVFIRLMRDIVNYTITQGHQTKQELLQDPGNPARKEYLERYADKEGTVFLDRFMQSYASLDGAETVEKIKSRARKSATSRAILFRSIQPKAGYEAFAAFMKKDAPAQLSDPQLKKLFVEYPPQRYSLADRGYITGLHPLELWLVGYKLEHRKASRKEILSVSKDIRLASYAWLINSNKRAAQDTRIRILLEQDAFSRIQRRWARLGYPFEKLVPSLATAIGTSADRPSSLVELIGILLNDGVRSPMRRFKELHFAKGTPYETVMRPHEKRAERVLDPAVARVVRAAMANVVENGTARRLRGAYVDREGKPLTIGAKTGTGDHRYDEYASGHRLIASRVVNRTGTIAFYIGDRFFGTVTAHVAGEKAAEYKFTSALSAQILKSLAPALQPLITPDGIHPPEIQLDPFAPPEPAKTAQTGAVVDPEVRTPPKKKVKKTSPPISSQDMMMDILQ